MRFLLLFLAGLCLLATPDAAAQTPEDPVSTPDIEQTLDDALDASVFVDPHLGPAGSCLRNEAVSEAKELYGDMVLLGNPVTDCLGKQCIGWPPEPFVSLSNCQRVVIETVRDAIGVWLHVSDA